MKSKEESLKDDDN